MKYKAKPIAKSLRQKRIERGLLQKQLAWRAGYSLQVLGDWESGKRVPSWRALHDWAQALNCELVVRERA
jgi:transcriptional regulator with XRE-family HTH domain